MVTVSAESSKPNVLIITAALKHNANIFRALSDQGLNIDLSLNTGAGYQKAQALSPHAIVIDSNVPRAEYLALLRKLSALRVTTAIPALLLTDKYIPEECVTALQAGAADYVAVACAPVELAERIRALLRVAGQQAWRRDRRSASRPADLDCAPEQKMLVNAARRMVEKNLADSPNLADICEQLQVSQHKLTTAFKQCLGLSYYQYVLRQKMVRAQALLLETALDVAAIGLELGFSSAANFSTSFKQHTGVSPRVYRQQHAKGATQPEGPLNSEP